MSLLILVVLVLPGWGPSYGEIEKLAIPGPNGINFHWWPKLPPVKGWHHDHEYSLHYGANALAPDGKTFADAETVMYAMALYKPRDPATTSVAVLIEQDRKRFLGNTPGVKIVEVEALVTADQKAFRSFTFFPAESGNWERVTYGEEGEFFLVFTLSSRSLAGYKACLPAYEDLIRRYKVNGRAPR